MLIRVQAVDTSIPSLARAYDYLLGGRANFAADRELAGRWRALYPDAATLLSVSRAHVSSCCEQLSRDGLLQFIDVGSGLPTAPSVHAAVRHWTGTRVVYVDRDPAVVAHARALVPPQRVSVLEGDLLEPEAMLWSLRPLVDLGQPACLILGLVIQALPDLGTARAVVDVLIRALAPGSYVVITAGGGQEGRLPDSVAGAVLTATDVAAFFSGIELAPPGVVDGLLLSGTGRKAAARPL
jgi:SAM-dependent methyltransferase